MRTVTYGSIEEFCEEFNDVIYDLEEGNYAEVVTNYDDAKEILKELVFYGYDIDFIEIEDCVYDGYCDAYSISVINGKIVCEKSKRGDIYPKSSASIVYFMEGINSKNIHAFEDTAIKYCVCIEDEDEDLCDCCPDRNECHEEISRLSEDKNMKDKKHDDMDVKIDKDEDRIHGFTFTSADNDHCASYSFYTSDEIGKDTLKMLMDIFSV